MSTFSEVRTFNACKFTLEENYFSSLNLPEILVPLNPWGSLHVPRQFPFTSHHLIPAPAWYFFVSSPLE